MKELRVADPSIKKELKVGIDINSQNLTKYFSLCGMKLERLFKNKVLSYQSQEEEGEFGYGLKEADEEAKLYGFTHVGINYKPKEQQQDDRQYDEAVKREVEMKHEFEEEYNKIKDLCLSEHDLKMKLPQKRVLPAIFQKKKTLIEDLN